MTATASRGAIWTIGTTVFAPGSTSGGPKFTWYSSSNSPGSADKFISGNEQETCVIQRRCLRAARPIKAGETFTRDMIDVLRPATPGAIRPHEIPQVIGAKALRDLAYGQELRWTDLG